MEPKPESWRFHELQFRVRDIYEKHDRDCGYGPDTMLIKLIGNAEVLKKIARKDPSNIEALDRALTNVFIWLSTVSNDAQIPMENVILEKYGNGCQRCRQIPCVMTHGQECTDSDNFLGTRPPKLPESLEDWQKHLANIYPNNFAQGLETALAATSERLLEEVGELISSTHADVERELSQYSRYRNHEDETFPWKGEIADVMAWGFAVAEVLKRLTDGKYSLETSLREKYTDGCPFCHSAQCACPREVTIIEKLRRKKS